MKLQQQGSAKSGLRYSFSRLALLAAPALIGYALLISTVLPGSAHSQINGRVTGAPAASSTAHETVHVATAKLPKAPAQVAMPAPPPIEYVPGMEEPLVAMGPVDEGETRTLRRVLKEFHDAPLKGGPDSDYADYAKPLLEFIVAHPKSNWNVALYTDLGLGYYHAGYYSRAFDAFGKAWELGRNADSSPQARLLVDRAVGELAKMHARVGHDKELDALLREVVGKRPIGGPATELIQGAREGLWAFRNNPGVAYLCGPRALKNVLKALNAQPKQVQVAEEARSGPHGFTLTQLAALADKAKLRYTLIERKPGRPVPVPSIVNWKVHHYAAIVGKQGNLYQVVDPTFGDASGSLLTARAIDEESSGYFLVPAQAMSAKGSWRTVSAKSSEARTVYGMGTTSDSVHGASGVANGCPVPTGQASANGPFSPVPNQTPMTQGQQKLFGGMAVSGCTPMVVGLSLGDTPVGYNPQKGVAMTVGVSYNSREAEQPATLSFGNVSPKWTHSWIGWVWDDPGTNREGWNVRRYASGGGGYDYVNVYNRTTGTWPAEVTDSSQLWRTPVLGVATNYEHRLPNGGKENFTLSDGATTYPRKLFLTSVTDAHGNVTTLNYDGTFRLTSVVDAMGRSTSFTYGLSGFPLLVTQITDPFGRTTQLTYDTSQRLSTITDPMGITSTFTYSTAEPSFVKTLATPYGTTSFSDTANSHDTPETNTRSLTIKDPLGFTDYTYFYQNPAITPSADSACLIPAGLSGNDNTLLQWRNTYHWDPHAFALGVTVDGSGNLLTEDFSKAYLTHWYHDQTTGFTGTAVASVKPPLEHRTWFNHPSQNTNYNGGLLDRPTFVGRVLDDNTTQLTSATYNAFGLPLTYVDPVGRATKYAYAANNIDLLTVQQLTTLPSTYTTIATFGSYNALHEPQTYTDAAGKVWSFTWNASGQPVTVTDPNSGVTTRNYDASGRLSTIVNANSQTVLTLTYDSADRIATRTDSEGYVLTYAYDNFDRIISITYPDGTTDLYDYNFQSGPNIGTPSLEVRKHTDRLGRVTAYDFDADRRLVSVTEPTSGTSTRTTSYHYYENGVLKDITDASGNVTHWDIDIESRPVAKTYGFGTSTPQTETYTYEQSTSRLKAVTDALNQVKSYAYAQDDRPLSASYIGALGTPNVSFTWDARFPRISSMTDGTGTTSYAYAAIGGNGALKLASIDGPFGNDTIGLTYDALGRLAGRNITGGNETFGYDAISRLITHGTPLGSFTDTYLGQTDQMASRSVTNGATTVSTNWGYDTNTNDRRLISIANSGVTRSYTLGYGTTPVNPYDIMSITDTAAAGHPFATQGHAYGYDLIDRLLTATATTPGNNSYAYDNLDNATTVTDSSGTTSPTYNGFNQISAWGATNYTYDTKGNLLNDGTRTYKWDIENRLIEIDYIGSTAKSQFSYDGWGHRTVDVETDNVGNVTTRRSLWCNESICQIRDGSDNVQSRILDEGEYNAVSGQKAVYMPDQLDSVRDVLDATTGTLIASFDYSPYGIVTQSNGPFAPIYQYAGLLFHPQSSLFLSATRAYDGKRWINRDPIGEAVGLNLYAYTDANPLKRLDPWGLDGLDIFSDWPPSSIPGQSTPCSQDEKDISLTDSNCHWVRAKQIDEQHYHGNMHTYKEKKGEGEWGSECTYENGKLVTGGNLNKGMSNPPVTGTANYYPDWTFGHFYIDPGGPRIDPNIYRVWWNTHKHPYPFK